MKKYYIDNYIDNKIYKSSKHDKLSKIIEKWDKNKLIENYNENNEISNDDSYNSVYYPDDNGYRVVIPSDQGDIQVFFGTTPEKQATKDEARKEARKRLALEAKKKALEIAKKKEEEERIRKEESDRLIREEQERIRKEQEAFEKDNKLMPNGIRLIRKQE